MGQSVGVGIWRSGQGLGHRKRFFDWTINGLPLVGYVYSVIPE